MWVQSLGQEHPLNKEMATHSTILLWRIPWTEEPGSLQFIGLHRIRLTEATQHIAHSEYIPCPSLLHCLLQRTFKAFSASFLKEGKEQVIYQKCEWYKAALSNMVATSHVWLVCIEMFCKWKIHNGFSRLITKKCKI